MVDRHAALVLAAGDPLVDVSVTVDDDETISKLDERSGNPSFERGGCESVSGGQIGAILSAVREDLGLEPKVCAGGSASNLAKAIAMLRKQEGFEPNAAFFGCRGNDEDGAYFARELDECGVRTIGPIAENARTGTCLCLVSGQTGERTMRTCNGASALVCAEDWPPASSHQQGLVGVDHVHAEGYYFRNPDLMRKILVTPTPKVRDNRER
uniref:Carbohydrate kinase PfkB domain-containing protein n=1 Tax=Chloropicon roscoffensis TaxID=1461544 RepID=A0A7S3FMB5_9CHLO